MCCCMHFPKAGLIEEMVNDTMEGMDEEGLDEAADKEVDTVLYELTEGILGKAPAVPDTSILVCTPSALHVPLFFRLIARIGFA